MCYCNSWLSKFIRLCCQTVITFDIKSESMARVFSINIEFQSRYYMALVSLYQHGADVACQVRYVDEDLQSLLQADSLEISLADKRRDATPDNPLAKKLVYCTTDAIQAYLHEHA